MSIYTFFSYLISVCYLTYPFFLPKNSASPQSGPERAIGPDLDFMEEIEELAKEFIDTTEKAMVLEKLWEENSRLSGKLWFF